MGGAPPPSTSPPGGAFAGAEAPFVAALCSELSPGSAELERFLHVLADALVDPAVQKQCADPVGGTDLLLLADEINFHLAERAAATSPPVAAFQLRPQQHASYSAFQKALTAFRTFMRLPLVSPSPPSPSPLGGVASTLGPLPFAAPSHGGKPSSVARSCPPECKGAAANAAITLDRVAANSLLLSQLQQLDLSARTKGADALRAELAAAPHDLRAMLESDIEHVDVGAFSLAASNLWRTIYRASSKGARHVLLTNESLVSDRSQAPNPQFEAFIKNLASGSLHLITEFMLNGNSNANKHKLFTASDSILNDYAIMNDRVRIVMEGFAAKHHSQAQAAESFLVNYRKLAKFARDSHMSVAFMFDFVWLPFWREYAFACAEAKESLGALMPLIQPSRLSEGGPFQQRLQQAFFNSVMQRGLQGQQQPPRQPPPLMKPPPPPPPSGKGNGPPPGSLPSWNPAREGNAGWVALPSPRPPHQPSRPETCRGWNNRGLCSFGQNCAFQHPGY